MHVLRIGASPCWKWGSCVCPGIVPFPTGPSARPNLEASVTPSFTVSSILSYVLLWTGALGLFAFPVHCIKLNSRRCCPHPSCCLFVYPVLWLIHVIVTSVLYCKRSGDKPRRPRGHGACYVLCSTQTAVLPPDGVRRIQMYS